MTIGIVLHPFGEKRQSGLGRYAFELAQALLRDGADHEFIIYTKGKPSIPVPFSGKNIRHVQLRGGILWREIGFLLAPRADVYFFMTPMLPMLVSPGRMLAVAHDFPYHYVAPRTFLDRIFWKILHILHGRSLRRATRIIAFSNYTPKEVKKLFHIDPSRVAVVRSGFTDVCAAPPQALLNAPQPYFLAVGAVKERKNTFAIVRALAICKKEFNLPHKLIIAGAIGNPYSEKMLQFIREHNMEEDVIFPGHMNDGQMSFLYQNAEALVFPSLIESFGLPVLEAAKCGIPVVTANEGGPAENGRGIALLVDPRNDRDIALAMRRIATDRSLRAELIAKGRVRAGGFSWKKAAEDIFQVIESL